MGEGGSGKGFFAGVTVTVETLLSWDLDGLDGFGEAVRRDGNAVRGLGEDVQTAVSRMFSRSRWWGTASDAARGTAQTRYEIPEAVGEALETVARAVFAAADAMAVAKSLLVDAMDLAARHGLSMSQRGDVASPVKTELPSTASGDVRAELENTYQVRCDAAYEAETMARQALAAASEADSDAAHAVRNARAIALGQDGASDDALEALGEIGVQDIPAAGTDPVQVAAWWESLGESGQQRMYEEHPEIIGNLDGIPFDARAIANETNVRNAIPGAEADVTEAEAAVAMLEAQAPGIVGHDADALRNYSGADLDAICLRAELEAADKVAADARARLTLYNAVLDENRHVVLFDPEHSRFAEIAGDLNADTENVAILVGGTGTNMAGMQSDYDRAMTFVDAAGKNEDSLAVITYMGGEMPQNIFPEATSARYAEDAGPGFASFGNGLVATTDAMVTVVAHSYAGPVLGAAEVAGLSVDNVVHVESAGLGPGVLYPSQYADPDTTRYMMTAPGDMIGYEQGGLGIILGLGGAPDQLEGIIQLDTGTYDPKDSTSEIVTGHSSVFNKGSTSFNNMLAVMTNNDVIIDPTPFTTPPYAIEPDTNIPPSYPTPTPRS